MGREPGTLSELEEARQRSVERGQLLALEQMEKAEAEVRGVLAALPGSDAPADPTVKEAVAAIARDIVGAASEQEVWDLEKVLGFSFDYRAADPELLNEDLHAAYLLQAREYLYDSFRQYLEDFVAENPQLLQTTQLTQQRLRLSPLGSLSVAGEEGPEPPIEERPYRSMT